MTPRLLAAVAVLLGACSSFASAQDAPAGPSTPATATAPALTATAPPATATAPAPAPVAADSAAPRSAPAEPPPAATAAPSPTTTTTTTGAAVIATPNAVINAQQCSDEDECGPRAGTPRADVTFGFLGPGSDKGAATLGLAPAGSLSVITVGTSYRNTRCAPGEPDSAVCPQVATTGGVRLTLTLPVGVSLVRWHTIVDVNSRSGASWACGQDGTIVTCDLMKSSGGGPFILQPTSAAAAVLVVRTTLAPGTDAGAVGAALSVPVAGGVIQGTASVSARVAAGVIAPRVNTAYTSEASGRILDVRQRHELRITAFNSGGLPLRGAAGAPTLALSSILPPARLSQARISGQGWRCAADAARTCTYTGTLRPGAPAPMLTASWPARLDRRGYLARWDITGTASYRESGRPGSVRFTQLAHMREPDTVSRLATHVIAPKGFTIVPGAAPRAFRLTLHNVGTAPAPVAGLRVRTGPGVRVAMSDPSWSCTPTARGANCTRAGGLATGAAARTDLLVSAPVGAAPSRRRVDITPTGRRGLVRGAPVAVRMAVTDPGDPIAAPRLVMRRNGRWMPWRDGSVTRVPVRDAFSYRINLINTGGHPLQPGGVVRVRQAIGASVDVESVVGSSGITCTAVRDISCTYRASNAVAPDAMYGQIAVTIRPSRTAKEAPVGAITAAVKGEKRVESIGMRLEVVGNADSLRPSQKVILIPSAGGHGDLVMAVRNTASGAVRDVAVGTTVPGGLAVSAIRAPSGWSCATPGRAINCTYADVIRGKARTPAVRIRLRATTARATTENLRWQATGVAVSDGSRQVGMRRGQLPVRGPIMVRAEASPSVILPSASRNPAPRVVSLDGKGSTSNGLSLRYRWTQRCLTAADAAAVRQCAGRVSPRARIASPNIPHTRATIPQVRRRTAFVFDLSITDGSATRTQRVSTTATVRQQVRQITPRSSGSTPAAERRQAEARAKAAADARARNVRRSSDASGRRAQAASWGRAARERNLRGPGVSITGGPVVSARPDEELRLTASVRGEWHGEVSYEWSQVSGPTTAVSDPRAAEVRLRAPAAEGTLLVYRVTAKGGKGRTATGQVMVGVGVKATAGSNAALSLAARAASSGRPVTLSLGGASLVLSKVTVPQGAVEQQRLGGLIPSEVDFSRSSLTVGALTFTNISGSITEAGVELATGTLTMPSSWGLQPIGINPQQPLVLAFSGSDGRSVSLTGQLTSPGDFAMLPLPSGWSGQTTLTFAGGSSVLSASATGDDDGSVNLSATISTGGTYNATVTANGLMAIGGSPLDLTGTITNAGGSVVSTVTGSLAGPVTLVEGVTVSGVTATWTPNASNGVVVTGKASIAIQSGSAQPVVLGAALTYSGRTDWNLSLTGTSGPSWNPLPGLTLTPSQFTGAVGMTKGAWAWDINAAVPSWRVSSVLSLSNLQLDLSDQCSAGTGPACPPGTVFLRMSTQAKLTPPIGDGFTANANAILGIGSGGGFSLQAGVEDLSLGLGIDLGSPSFNVTYGFPDVAIPAKIGAPSFSGSSEGGFSMTAIGSVRIPGLGSFSNIAANITSLGWSLGGWDPDGVSLGSGNGSQSGAAWGWSSFASTMSLDLPGIGLKSIQMAAGSVSVGGSYSAPAWFSKIMGTVPAPTFGTIQLNPQTGFFNASIGLPGDFTLPKMGGTSLGSTGLSFDIESNSSGLYVGVSASTTLSTLAMGGGTGAAPTLDMTLSYDVATTTAAASLSFVDPSGWKDAFGVSGLVIDDASFTFEINLATFTPGMKLVASGDLPPSVAGPFKVPGQGIPVTVGAEFDATNPCIDVQVGNSAPGSPPVLQVDGGVVSASFFEFIVAPDGCQLSPESPPIAPGFQMAFDGAVLGVQVDVSAALTLAPNTSFKASMTVGAFSLGDLQFQETQLSVFLDEAQGINDVSFSGGFSILGNGISVAGSLDQQGPITTGSLTMSQEGTFSVGGFSLSKMKVAASVTFGGGQNEIDISASGQMDLLGTDIDITNFTVDIDNGVPEQVTFDASVTNLGVQGALEIDGTFDMNYQASPANFDVSASAVLTTAVGFTIGSQAQPATLNISPECASFQGDIAYAGIFNAQLAGTIVYQPGCQSLVTNAAGQQVAGSPGDFSFSADNVGITLADFDILGSVGIGSVGGDAYATVNAAIDLSPQADQPAIGIQAEIQSNGNFTFTGQGQVDLAGFDLQLNVAASNSGGNISISGNAQLGLPGGTNVDLGGSFSEVGGAPSTTLYGSLDPLELGGFTLGQGSFTLTQTPSEMSVLAAVSTSFGNSSTGVSVNGNISFLAQEGAPPLFQAALDGDLTALGARFDVAASFSDCDDNCTQPAPVVFSVTGGISSNGFNFSLNTTLSTSGEFGLTMDSNGGASSSGSHLGFGYSASFNYTIHLFVGTYSPYFSIYGSGGVDVQGEVLGGWFTVFDGSISLGFNPFSACVSVKIIAWHVTICV